ncbi:unnamed protein product [Peniophora sp. CBMAI 1063]|nr:unnamed protein product [Peniophora sp. CBMAI 1063]
MASVSAPPPRGSDNVRSGDRGNPTRAVNRGRGGVRNGPSRRRGAGSGGGAAGSVGGQGTTSSVIAPAPTPKPEPKVTTTPAPAATNAKNAQTPSVAKPSPASARPGRKNGNLPQPKAPAVNVMPASPNVDKAATTPKRPRNERRPRNKPSGSAKAVNGSAATPKSVSGKGPAASEPVTPAVEVSKDGPPHVTIAPVIEVTKDAPPHLAAPAPDKPNMTIKTSGIDSLVDHVRHMAMERPITPGSASHIDWAGDDEDDTLPDLDDWGVPSASTTSTGGLDKLMSPILDDSLKQLPTQIKTPLLTASGLSPSIGSLKDELKTEKSPEQHTKAPPPAIDITPSLATSPSAPSSLATTARPAHNPVVTDVSTLNTSHSDSSIPAAPHSAPAFNATHARSRTLGRPGNMGMNGVPHRQFHSGSTTPSHGPQARHGRTQSTPPSAGGPARHSRQGSRPVIAGTALAQIARTLGGGGSALKREAATATPP